MTQFRITSWLIFTIMMLTGCNLSITNESVVRKDGRLDENIQELELALAQELLLSPAEIDLAYQQAWLSMTVQLSSTAVTLDSSFNNHAMYPFVLSSDIGQSYFADALQIPPTEFRTATSNAVEQYIYRAGVNELAEDQQHWLPLLAVSYRLQNFNGGELTTNWMETTPTDQATWDDFVTVYVDDAINANLVPNSYALTLKELQACPQNIVADLNPIPSVNWSPDMVEEFGIPNSIPAGESTYVEILALLNIYPMTCIPLPEDLLPWFPEPDEPLPWIPGQNEYDIPGSPFGDTVRVNGPLVSAVAQSDDGGCTPYVMVKDLTEPAEIIIKYYDFIVKQETVLVESDTKDYLYCGLFTSVYVKTNGSFSYSSSYELSRPQL